MNREQEEAGEPLYANPRNTAAGTMRNLDPSLVARRGLSMRRRARSDASVLTEWWAYGWPMSLWLGVAPLVLYSDRLLLRPWVSDETLGAYSAASARAHASASWKPGAIACSRR